MSAAAAHRVHPSGAPYATWWSRFGAELIDGLIVYAIARVALALLPDALTLAVLAVAFLYNGLLDGGSSGQTVGKRVLRIRVIDDATGRLLGPERGLTRALLPLVFSVAAILGDAVFAIAAMASLLDALWPLWDSRRQTWHDKTAGSVVVRGAAIAGS